MTSWLNITGKDESLSNEIYNLIRHETYLSNTELLGVKYQYYFEKLAQVQDTSTHYLTILDQNNSGGEFSLQTQVKLPDNFCSNILETAVDFGDKVNQLHIKLSIPLKFDDLTSDNLNSSRDKIKYDIWTIGNVSTSGYLKTSNGDYQWRATASDSYYFLQTYLTNNAFWGEGENAQFYPRRTEEYVHYNSFVDPANQGDIYYPFFINLADRSAINSTKFLGNLGLVGVDTDLELVDNYNLVTTNNGTTLAWDGNNNFFLKYAPCYWVETRPAVRMYQNDDCIRYPMNLLYNDNDLTYNDVRDTELIWPSTYEDDYYWEEYGVETPEVLSWRSSAPVDWDEICGDTAQHE